MTGPEHYRQAEQILDALVNENASVYPAGGDLLADIDTVLRALDEADRA